VTETHKKASHSLLLFMSNLLTKTAGTLILVGAVEFIVGMILAEVLYSGYSARRNYISDLGVGPSALVFNASIFLFGLMVVVASYFILRGMGAKLPAVLIFIAGVGAIGVGVFTENARVFTEDAGTIHFVMSAVAFFFGGISAIAAYRLQKPPMNYISIIMGVIALTALVLFGTGNYLGLDKGGMERMIAYPIVLWAIAFGGHLIGLGGKT